MSADLHPATGQLTVFVYDGHEGGAGFAERGFAAAGRLADRDRRGDRRAASARPGARPASSRPNAATATSRSPSTGAVALLRCLLSGAANSGTALDPTKPGTVARSGYAVVNRVCPDMGRPPSGGERGSPYGPAPGGQSRVRYPRKPSCNRGKLPAGHAEPQRVLVSSPMLPDRGHIRRGQRAELLLLSLTWTRPSSPGRAPWRSPRPSTGTD